MFKTEKIHHAKLILREDLSKALIQDLHEKGICQLKEAEIDLENKFSQEQSSLLNSVQARFKYVADTLEDYKPIIQPESAIKALFSPKEKEKQKVKLESPENILKKVNKHLDSIEPNIKQQIERLETAQNQIKQNEFTINNLFLLPDIKTSTLKSTDNFTIKTGIMNKSSFLKIKNNLTRLGIITAKEHEKEKITVIACTTEENAEEADSLLHQEGFETLTFPFENKTPINIIKDIKKENEKEKTSIRDIEASLRSLQKQYNDEIIYLTEELEISKQKIEALKNFKTKKSFSVMEAWIPAYNFDKFMNLLENKIKNFYLEIDEKNEAPTIYKNAKIIKPFEMIMDLYSPPKYKGFDPTPLLAFFFAIFFGFMLDDFFYGFILILLALAMVFGAGKVNENIKNFGALLLIFGITTMAWGVFFGAYFGDFFTKLGIQLPIVVDAMKDVMTALIIALAMGATHLLVGLISGFIVNIKEKKILNAFHSQGVWISFMLGMLSIIFRQNTLGLILMGIAVVMQITFTFISKGLVPSVLSIFDFSGFLGDLFSYARLMALGIGTSGISLAVNFMVFLSVDMIPWVGVIIAIIIFIIGHLFNLAMNGLGAFIHTTRLHFLEFFTKFYDGGGKKYVPFKADRKTTTVD